MGVSRKDAKVREDAKVRKDAKVREDAKVQMSDQCLKMVTILCTSSSGVSSPEPIT